MKNAVQIEDIMPETNAGAVTLQKMVSLSGLLGDMDPVSGTGNYDDGLNYFNQDDQNYGGDMNFDDGQFQINPSENRPIEEIKQSSDILINPENLKDNANEKLNQGFNFEPWVSANVEK